MPKISSARFLYFIQSLVELSGANWNVGRKRLRYIKEHHRALYTSLLISGKLNSHLAEINNRATEMFDRLVKQQAEKEGVTEQLKAQDQMAWVGAMNNIRHAVEEIVLSELIYN